MGIGMYERREFGRLIGGEIFVQSEYRKGTTITLHIPSFEEGSEYVISNA